MTVAVCILVLKLQLRSAFCLRCVSLRQDQAWSCSHPKVPKSVLPYMRLEVCKPKCDMFKSSMVSILKLFSKSVSILKALQKILTEIHLKKILQQNFRGKKDSPNRLSPQQKLGKKLWSIGPRSWCPYLSFKALANRVDHPSSLGLRQPKATELPQIATRKPRCERLKEIIRFQYGFACFELHYFILI